MLWDGLAASEGQGPSPGEGCTAAHPGPADREAGGLGGERAPSVLGSCRFAPGRWFGKEGLELVMSRWLSLKAVPRDTVS